MNARNLKEKPMALKLFEFVEQFIMDTFLLKLTKFEKTGSQGKIFISLGKLMINSIFKIRSRSRLQFSIVEFAFLLTIEMH